MSDYNVDRSRTVRRLQSRLQNKRRNKLILITSIAAVVLIFVSNWAVSHFGSGGSSEVAAKPKPPIPKTTFMVMGIAQKGYEQRISGLTLLVYNPVDKKLNGIDFNVNISVQVPGRGLDLLGKAMFAGLNPTLQTVYNLTGIEIKSYASMSDTDFRRLVNRSHIADFLPRVEKTNIDKKTLVYLSKDFKKLKTKDINILPLPTKQTTVAGKVVTSPDKLELAKMIDILWGKSFVKKRVKVVILNGIGKPGLATSISSDLIKSDFEVVDVTNANSFNYKETEIRVYDYTYKAKAQKIKSILKVGKITDSSTHGLADITIILGKDFVK
ncbi:MAG: LytR family transcriptional regulator [Actinobacteria bacterium]|nr:MAG: LytR family transcriptional regulator [Actinomycetota bacterium]